MPIFKTFFFFDNEPRLHVPTLRNPISPHYQHQTTSHQTPFNSIKLGLGEHLATALASCGVEERTGPSGLIDSSVWRSYYSCGFYYLIKPGSIRDPQNTNLIWLTLQPNNPPVTQRCRQARFVVAFLRRLEELKHTPEEIRSISARWMRAGHLSMKKEQKGESCKSEGLR